ncbi:MAG: DUF2023 family protein [Rikenellaceae bacterium]
MAEELLRSHEMRVFSNHVYEFKKGVRHMVLYTVPKRFEEVATARLKNQNIDFVIQHVSCEKINLFFGKKECINAIKLIASRPLNKITPEEDFILGMMLGYDVCAQCDRYCKKKGKDS